MPHNSSPGAGRWRWLAMAALPGLLFGVSLQAMAQSAADASAAAAEVEKGRQLYMANGCFSCHGTVGQGGERSGAPKLAPGPYPFEAFRALVRTPREAMPRVDAQYVSDANLQSIHRYLASIAPSPAAREIPVLRALHSADSMPAAER